MSIPAADIVIKTVRYAVLSIGMHFALIMFVSLTNLTTAQAHSGGMDKNRCHTNNQTGDRHCHKKPDNSLTTIIPKDERPACQDFPRCTGCGCRGGPGYRDRKSGQCVGYLELDQVCGNPLTTNCDFENAPNTGENELCATGGRRKSTKSNVEG